LLLPVDGLADVVEAFEVHETIAVVLAGEAVEFSALVLAHTAVDVVGHADVEGAAATDDN
jgi:hypothetical protein